MVTTVTVLARPRSRRDEELAALAEAGAATVVTMLATDLWQGTRATVLRLFRRSGRRRRAAVRAQLDDNAALVRAAALPDDVRQALFGLWSRELADLLRQHPAAREPLARPAAPAARPPSGPRRLRKTNTARDSGTVYAVQRGDQSVHRPPPAGPPRDAR